MVTSPKIALMVSETRRNLQTMISEYKTMHELGTMDALTHIPEIRSGITLRISARKPSDIA